ncbi:alpha/beta-hydrolase [Aspergillus heteromorphus CBS 117.55]|uniref:Alpha/beta-hydrolase n=1 Tax=Aspergillus heteromorphus CBS 117.55 TaxID=1448321 RepID=A0A317WRF6_9EURO|nr:alpha/beta-hydrolase [Aspergillus heteromorphus CBS 117.55]PWY86750.1 alpha/beta-hydrolase [Aspergillus heteromorphus CBS 117.55]
MATGPHTHIYKSHPDLNLNLHLDVYTPNVTPQTPKPVILWFHGGYLITGSRKAIPSWLLAFANTQQWSLVSADYRVLPESTGLATLEDTTSAYEWVAHSLKELHPESCTDTNRIIIGGASAGGWCTLTTALHFCAASYSHSHNQSDSDGGSHNPSTIAKPAALFLLYPMVDPGTETWARGFALPGSSLDADAEERVMGEIATSLASETISDGEDFPKSEAEVLTRKRVAWVWAVLQKGLFLEYLTGVPGFAGKLLDGGVEGAAEGQVRKLFPLDFGTFEQQAFPRTVVVHGVDDQEVSCQESERLVSLLAKADVQVDYFPVTGADHAFDLEIGECVFDVPESGEPSAVLGRALRALQGFVEI